MHSSYTSYTFYNSSLISILFLIQYQYSFLHFFFPGLCLMTTFFAYWGIQYLAMNRISPLNLEKLSQENLDEYIFTLYSENAPQSRLGYVNKNADLVTITLPESHIDLHIQQSISQLSSTKETTSTTGFVCWSSSVQFSDWILSGNSSSPIKLSKSDTVLELGSGVGGICAATLSGKVGHYVATDQKHVLKLLSSNLANNLDGFESSTMNSDLPTTLKKSSHINATANTETNKHEIRNKTKRNDKYKNSRIDVVEFDWEDLELGLDRLGHTNHDEINIIIACDTIYNEYLITPFINAIKALLTQEHTIALITVQLRDAITMETFVTRLVNDTSLVISVFKRHLLSKDLKNGFEVYHITRRIE